MFRNDASMPPLNLIWASTPWGILLRAFEAQPENRATSRFARQTNLSQNQRRHCRFRLNRVKLPQYFLFDRKVHGHPFKFEIVGGVRPVE